MALIYRTVGSLSKLLYELRKEQITFLNSLENIMSFNNEFESRLLHRAEGVRESVLGEKAALQQKLIDLSTELIDKTKAREAILAKEKQEIGLLIDHFSTPTRNIFLKLYFAFKRYTLRKRQNKLSTKWEEEIQRPFKNLEGSVFSVKQQLQHYEQDIDKLIEARIRSASEPLHTAKLILEENKPFLLGAIGEQKTLNELEKLPDSFFVINDFQYYFRPRLHKKDSDEWIRSIQCDHVIVGPTGVFAIETKNWSTDSIQDIELYSPVKQVRRTSYAMFMLLNTRIAQNLFSFNHHWGSQKIPVHSVILMVNKKPVQEFPYVKILSLSNLCYYITRFQPILSTDQVQQLADFLIYGCS